MSVSQTNYTIHWIAIYPVISFIHPLISRGHRRFPLLLLLLLLLIIIIIIIIVIIVIVSGTLCLFTRYDSSFVFNQRFRSLDPSSLAGDW